MSKGKGYRYPQEFKEQIYELYKAGQSVPKLSSEYGIPTGTIYKWISELKPFTTKEDGAKMNRQELQAMKKRIKELELENEILKKATAIFAKKH